MPTISDYVSEVRRHIDELTLAGEDVITDADVQELLSSNFSDTDITDRLHDGGRYIAARVRSQYIPALIIDIEPDDFAIPYVSAKKILRFLLSTVKLSDGTQCDRRTRNSHRKLESSGQAASATAPCFVYEDFLFEIYDGSTNPVGSGAKAVKVPDVDDDIIDMGEKFRQAIVQYAVSSCFQTIQNLKLANIARGNMIEEIEPYLLIPINAREITRPDQT